MDIKPGDVVQIDPSHDDRFGSCLLLVTEVKSWGVVGFVRVPGHGECYYYRCPNEAMLRVGQAPWVPDDIKQKP